MIENLIHLKIVEPRLKINKLFPLSPNPTFEKLG